MPPFTPPVYPSTPTRPTGAGIDIGKWIGEGWQIFKRDWFTFMLASLVAAFLSLVTLTITAGPFLLGLYFMAFKTMRGEKAQVSDIFRGFEQFGLAFLAWIIEIFIHISLGGWAESAPLMGGLVSLALSPLVVALFAFVYPLILDRKLDIGAALNEAWKVVISRYWLMFWVFGLVLQLLPIAGAFACLIGFFILGPLTICASAAAYKDVFGMRSMPSGPTDFNYWSGK
jgi:uncharacterized membrane protein